MKTPEEQREELREQGVEPGEIEERVPYPTSDRPVNAPAPRPLALPLVLTVLCVVVFVLVIAVSVWARSQG